MQEGIIGGAERYALELARHVADEADTSLVTFGKRDCEYRQGHLRIRVLGNPHYVRGQKSNPIRLGLLREVLGSDIVHCHQQHVVASSLAALLCRLTQRRVFVSDLGGGGWDISSYISTDRWYHGHLHISEYSRDVYGHTAQRWAHVVYGGVDVQKFSPDPEVKRDGTVLYVGRLLPHKGVDDLIRAVPPETPLQIIGKPYDTNYLADLKELAAGKQVRFLHSIDDEGLIAAYRKASCVVLPSVYRTMYGCESRVPELLGQTLIEGMACGTPAICTEVASMPEVVQHGVTGFVVPPNSPEELRRRIAQLRSDDGLVQQLGGAGRSRVLEQFYWPSVARKCLRIYQNSPDGLSSFNQN